MWRGLLLQGLLSQWATRAVQPQRAEAVRHQRTVEDVCRAEPSSELQGNLIDLETVWGPFTRARSSPWKGASSLVPNQTLNLL